MGIVPYWVHRHIEMCICFVRKRKMMFQFRHFSLQYSENFCKIARIKIYACISASVYGMIYAMNIRISRRMTSMKKISTRDICLISVFVALIVSLSQLAIPLPGGVPLTLQTFIVPFSAAVLGAKRGAIAAIVYLLLGAIGLPVFAGFGGGFGRIIGPWGGFLLSYPFMAFIVGFAADRQKKLWLAVGLAIGSLLNLTMGMIQFAIVTQQPLWAAFLAAMRPFLLPELIKMVTVFVTAPGVRKLLGQINMEARGS